MFPEHHETVPRSPEFLQRKLGPGPEREELRDTCGMEPGLPGREDPPAGHRSPRAKPTRTTRALGTRRLQDQPSHCGAHPAALLLLLLVGLPHLSRLPGAHSPTPKAGADVSAAKGPDRKAGLVWKEIHPVSITFTPRGAG